MKASNIRQVMHVVPALFDKDGGILGGAERYAFELARHMAEATPTRLVSFGEKDREEQCGSLSVRVLGNAMYVRGQRTNPISGKLLTEILQADVVHCHQQHILASSLTALACRLTGRRVFVSDLGGGGWDLSGYISTDDWFDGHLHISRYSRRIAGHSDNPKAHVIMGGVDVQKFSPSDAIERDGRALFVGRLMPHKGVNDLIAAVPPNLPLEVIGQPYDQQFTDDLYKLSEGKRINFRHNCDDAALVQAYRQALCIVLPSVYQSSYGQNTKTPELLGQTLLEGMACGAPAICTDAASMPEVVEDGVTGFVVPQNDPAALRDRICRLRILPELAKSMGLAGRQRVLDRFTWPAVVNRCLEIYAI